jgi:hypothetical protein
VEGGTLRPIFNLSEGRPIFWRWSEVRLSMPAVATETWACKLDGLPNGWVPERVEAENNHLWALAPQARQAGGKDYVFVFMDRVGHQVTASATGRTLVAAEALLAEVREAFPLASAEAGAINVTFWAYSPNGPQQVSRELDAPEWGRIAENYEEATRAQLAQLVDPDFRPGRGGQLLLWHGDPGTGKTTALRALARSWSAWADVHYITDPEQFFGAHSDYMLQVMLAGQLGAATEEPRWRLLVLEDASELLGVDAKHEAGAAFGRFLNVVDGMIGQGLRVLVLVTTNEANDRWHDAVARPGRAAAQVEFNPLTDVEASAWLARRGIEGEYAGGRILADLYAIADERPARQRRSPGFAPA